MPEIEDIRNQYLKDADMMGSKSRFGFFSIPPSAATGKTMFEQKKAIKDQNGRVITAERNILSGPTSSGTMKKSFFQYSNSVFNGDPFMDPGKNQRISQLEKSKKLAGKDVYKPLSLAKTPNAKAAYEYIPEKPVKKTVKDCIDENGKVKVQQRNITTNPQSKVEKQRRKQFKYIPDQYENHLKVEKQYHKKSIEKRGQGPFRASSPVKQLFSNNRQIFGQQPMNNNNKSQLSQRLSSSAKKHLQSHEGPFKPSNHKKYDTFSYPQYLPGGTKQLKPNKQTVKTQRPQTFKLVKQPNNYKPSPSITTMKSNMMRKIR